MALPPVHLERSYKRYVHTKASMVSSALIAEEYTDVGGAPFWIFTATIEA
jgi:hypothetical protein